MMSCCYIAGILEAQTLSDCDQDNGMHDEARV